MICFRSRRGSERERMTCSRPAGATSARVGDLILVVLGRDSRDGCGGPGWTGVGYEPFDFAGIAAGSIRETRRHFAESRKFRLAWSADSGSLWPFGTGGDPLRNQGPNKAWDATRQSGLVRFRFTESHTRRSPVICGGRLHPHRRSVKIKCCATC
jgi:hypothetical protein